MSGILKNYSVELTARDKKSLDLAKELLEPGTEVFIAALPNDKVDDVVAACARLRQDGLTPVPHVVARNIESEKDLDTLLGRLVAEAGMERCLVLGGDRDTPAGSLNSSLQILETGLIQKRGVKTIRIGSYPEGHPKIPEAVLDKARADKLAIAARDGLDVTIVSQFVFEAEPIVGFPVPRRRRRPGRSRPPDEVRPDLRHRQFAARAQGPRRSGPQHPDRRDA